MASKKTASVECTIDRVGVSWRKNPLTGEPTTCVVEMRLVNSPWRLHFGSYKTKNEAMIARDYAAILRVSAGEDGTSAGGFNADDHPSICEFEESYVIFESMDFFKVRCDEYKRLHILYCHQSKEKCGANSPYKEFCKEVRNDITIAIGEFFRRYPHKFTNGRSATEAAKALPQSDGSPNGGIHFIPSSSNSESSRMGENKQTRSTLELEQFMSKAHEYHTRPHNGFMNKGNFPSGIETFNHLSSSPNGKLCHVIRGFNANNGDSVFDGQSPGTSPGTSLCIKQDSKYFGVQSTSLQKWVAKVRVVEREKPKENRGEEAMNKEDHVEEAVDKLDCVKEAQSRPCLLGFFNSEEDAARAVDAARKLLECKENHPPNFPCNALNAYLERIPQNWNLINLKDDSMFEELTHFIRQKAREYVASFYPNIMFCSDQVQLAKDDSLESRYEGFEMQDDGVSMARVSNSFRSSYESYNTQLAPSFKGVVTTNSGQWMSPTSITYTNSSAPGSVSTGTSMEDETGLFNNNRNNYRQEMAQIKEQLAEGRGVHLQLVNSSFLEMGEVADHDTDCACKGQIMGNDDQYMLPNNDRWLTEVNDFLFPNGDECFEDQTAMDIDEMVKVDIPIQPSSTIPHESDNVPDFNHAPSYIPVTTPNSTSEVLEKVMSEVEGVEKVVSKVALNKVMSKTSLNKKVMSKAEMVEKRFKSSTLLAKEALLAARLNSERVKLDMAVQKSNKVKIANLRTARDDGVISNEEFKQQVKEILNLQ